MNKFLPVLLTMALIIGFFILAPTFMTSRAQEAALSIAEVSIQMEQDTMRTLNVHTTLNNNELAWVSSDSTLLIVHQGRLTALNAGLVTVWVFHDETALSDSITIEILEVPLTPQALNDTQPLKPIDLLDPDIEIPSESEPEVPVEPEPEVPSDLEPKVSVEPELEVPVVEEPKEEVVTPPTIFTVTITNETGVVITTLELEEGSLITTSSLELSELFKGFFLEEETCEDEPFDLETPITENLTLIEASYNDEAPCLQLDYIVLSGRPVAGSTLTVDIYPIGANVTISWYTSVNNRTYREIQGESSSTFTVRPEDSGKFIRVYVVSDSNPPVVRYDTAKLDVFKTVESEVTCKIILTATDLIVIYQNLAGCYELGANIDLSGYTDLTQSFINGTFTGILDGSGFSILNLTINSSQDYIGLFQIISGASLTNLTLENFNIIGREYVGTLAGSALHSTLSSIQLISNQVSGTRILGGMVGQGVALTISNSALSNTTILGSSNQLGGLIGLGQQLTLSHNTLTQTSISGDWLMGGLVGYMTSGPTHISNTVMTHTTVNGIRDNVGGIVGILGASATIIYSTLSHVNITGRSNVGGLVGVTNGTVITDAVVSGSLTGNSPIGIVGNSNTTATITDASFTGTRNGQAYSITYP